MTPNEKILFTTVASLGSTVSEMLGTQAEMNRLLADKLPNVSSAGQAALRASADELDQRMKTYGDAARKLSTSIPKD